MREVDLIKYLPYEIRKYYEYKVITSTENYEFNNLNSNSNRVLNESFILTASEFGISKFEKMLNITTDPSLTLDERRMYILTIYNMQTPYTERRLREMLNGILGEGNYALTINHNKYEISLVIFTGVNLEIIFNLFNKVVPANMLYNYKLQFYSNRHTVALGAGIIGSHVVRIYPKLHDDITTNVDVRISQYTKSMVNKTTIYPKLISNLTSDNNLYIGSVCKSLMKVTINAEERGDLIHE